MKNSLLTLFVCLVSFGYVFSQTTILTNHTNNNGNGSVTFNVHNGNAFDIIITDLKCHLGTTATNNVQLLYRTTAINYTGGTWGGGTIGAGQNGWTSAGSAVVSNSNTANGVVNALSGMYLTIPAGATYGLAFSATTMQYMTLPGGVNTFTGGGVDLITGDNISWGGVALPDIPVNYPRGLIGGITFIPAVPCTSPPTAGTITASQNPVCPSVSSTFTLNGASMGTGQTYQWQISPDNVTFTDIPGATSYTYTASQTTQNYYRCVLTCSGMSSTTPSLLLQLNSFINCYCNSAATYTGDEEILNVSFGTLNNSSTCATTGGPGSTLNTYSNYTGIAAPQVARGASYPFSVNVGTCGGSYNNWTKAWIDYNQNGLFTDPGEEVYNSNNYFYGPNTQNGTIMIPLTATIGLTRMRVINSETTVGNDVQPCAVYYYGETEDYLVEIMPVPTCPQPTAFSLITASTTTAEVQWTAGGSETAWQLEYDPQGFTLGTGMQMNGASSPETIPALTPNSFYQVYVRAVCGPGDTSFYTGPITFNTYGQGQFLEYDNECPDGGFVDISGSGTNLNLTDDTEAGVTLPWPWLVKGQLINTITVGNNGGLMFNTTTGNVGYDPAGSGMYPYNQDLNTPLGGVYYESIGSTPGSRKFIIQWDDVAHYTFPAATDGSTFEIIYDEATTQIYYVYDDVMMSNTSWDNGADAVISLVTPSQTVEVSNNDATYLTNNTCVNFSYSDCPRPTNFALDYLFPDEAAITWDAGLANETEWTIVWGPQGFDPTIPGQETGSVTSTATSTTLPLLEQLTNYDVYIYANCSPALTSNALMGSFMTPPFCSNPTNILANTNVDEISAQWSWAATSGFPVTGFNIRYGMSGFDLYSPTESTLYPGTGTNFADTINSPALLGGGVYQIYVQALCAGSDDTSNYVGPITVVMPLTNDFSCDAEMLNVDGTVYTFDNTGATGTETAIAPPATGAQTTTGWTNSTLNNSTWFTFVAPASGRVRINNTAINYNGQVAVYSVDDCLEYSTFTLEAANDNEIDGTSLAPNFTICGLTPNATYYLMHDGFNGTTGNYSIKITPINLEAGTAAPLTEVCTGATIDLFETVNGNNSTAGVWSSPLPGVNISIDGATFTTAGLAYEVFNLQYRITDGCAYDSIVTQVQVYPPSSAGEDGTISTCRNQPINLLAGLDGNADLNGTWYNPQNAALSSSSIIAGNVPGQFNYDYIVSNGVCPNDTSNVIVTINNCDYLSIVEETFGGVSIYPNPSKGMIYVANEFQSEAFDYTVTDANGRVLKAAQKAINGSATTTIDMSGAGTGIYFIRLANTQAEKVFRVVIN